MIVFQEQIIQPSELWIYQSKKSDSMYLCVCVVYVICTTDKCSTFSFIYQANIEVNIIAPFNYIMEIAMCKFMMMTSMFKWMQCKHNQTKIPKNKYKLLTALYIAVVLCCCKFKRIEVLYYINAIHKKKSIQTCEMHSTVFVISNINKL